MAISLKIGSTLLLERLLPMMMDVIQQVSDRFDQQVGH